RRHGGCRKMEGAQEPPDEPQGRDHFAVQPGRFVVEVTEAHDLDEVEQPGGPLPADLEDLPVHPPPVLTEELADALPLVVRAGFEIGTIRRTGDLREAVLPAAGRTDQAVQSGATPLSLSGVAIDTRDGHLTRSP